PFRDRRHHSQTGEQRANRGRGALRPRDPNRHRRGRGGGDRRVSAPRPRQRVAGGVGPRRTVARNPLLPAHRAAGRPGDARLVAQDGMDPPGQGRRRRLRDLVRAARARLIDTQLVTFAGVSVLLSVTPGPDMAFVTRNALAHGRRGVVLTTSGIALALMIWVTATAVGLSALLRTSGEILVVL